MTYGVVGLTPITALALSILEVIPLHISGLALIGAAIGAGFSIEMLWPGRGRSAVRGYVAGLLAVLVYDCTRLPFVLVGNWPDFIPKIGAWLLNTSEAHWSVGYVWRYLGNGAGMGLAFAMLAPFTDGWPGRRKAGVLYGMAIWTGLLLTVLIAPDGQEKTFVLNPTTLSVSLTGHIVYGGVLGSSLYWWEKSAR